MSSGSAGERTRAPRTFESLQWLRGLGALAVVLFHATARDGRAFLAGQAGVDVFFVLSGVVMWGIAGRGVRPGIFLLRRAERIVPLYWLATSLFIAGAVLHLYPNVVLTWDRVAASFLFLPYRGQEGELWPVLVQGWTLNYEAFFYLLFAAALPIPARWRLAALLAVFVGLFALGVSGASSAEGFWPDIRTFYTNPIILEFAAGLLLPGFTERWRHVPALGWCLAGAGALAFALVAVTSVTEPRAVVFGGPAVALVAGLLLVERAGALPKMRWLTALGDASFSVYLFHTFGVSVMAKLEGGRLPFLVSVLLLTAAGVAAGLLAHRLVERPLARRFALARRPALNAHAL